MNNTNILTQDDLEEITDYRQTADIARCLREQGVRVFTGKGGKVWTTIQLINAAGGVTPGESTNSDSIEIY